MGKKKYQLRWQKRMVKESKYWEMPLVKKAKIDTWIRVTYEDKDFFERIMNFWKEGRPHIIIDNKCPLDNILIAAVELLLEDNEVDLIVEKKKSEGFTQKELENLKESLLGDENLLAEFLKKYYRLDFFKLKQEKIRIDELEKLNGVIPIQCPNKHLLWYDLKQRALSERKEEWEYDKYIHEVDEILHKCFSVSASK